MIYSLRSLWRKTGEPRLIADLKSHLKYFWEWCSNILVPLGHISISFHLCYTIDQNLISKSRYRVGLPFLLELLFFIIIIITTCIFQLKSSNQVLFISDWETNYQMILYTATLFSSVLWNNWSSEQRNELGCVISPSSICCCELTLSPEILLLPNALSFLALGSDCFWS